MWFSNPSAYQSFSSTASASPFHLISPQRLTTYPWRHLHLLFSQHSVHKPTRSRIRFPCMYSLGESLRKCLILISMALLLQKHRPCPMLEVRLPRCCQPYMRPEMRPCIKAGYSHDLLVTLLVLSCDCACKVGTRMFCS